MNWKPAQIIGKFPLIFFNLAFTALSKPPYLSAQVYPYFLIQLFLSVFWSRLHLLTQTSYLLFLPLGRRKFRFKSNQTGLKRKNFRANLKFWFSWGWTWLPYFRVLRQYSSPASLAYADLLSALPPTWSAQVPLQVQPNWFKTKKTSEQIWSFDLAGVGLEPTASGLWARRAANCSTQRRNMFLYNMKNTS